MRCLLPGVASPTIGCPNKSGLTVSVVAPPLHSSRSLDLDKQLGERVAPNHG